MRYVPLLMDKDGSKLIAQFGVTPTVLFQFRVQYSHEHIKRFTLTAGYSTWFCICFFTSWFVALV